MAPRTILQTIGVLFPYTNLLRINEEQELTSTCSGLSALFAIMMVVAILVMKIKEVVDKTTIVSTSQAKVDLEPPMINISTNMQDYKYFPYMLALGYYQDIHYNSTGSAVAEHRTHTGAYSNPNRTLTQVPIALETCTTEHFKVVPNINTMQHTWGISNWMCLPLNQTWEIGGDYELSALYKSIQVNLTCTYSQNNVDCGYYKLYTLNSFINPIDPVNPSTYYISQDTVLLKNQSYYMYGSKLDQNILESDESITPQIQINTTTSTESNRVEQKAYMQLSPVHMTILRIEKSEKTTTYTRTYLKLLDALAYVGGIFSSLLALFFFLGMYMRFYYEMKFAQYYYNSNDARGISFVSYVKQGLFGVLASTPLKPDWPVEERRISLRATVIKVLDIFYLHKRIAFLEKAITVLLDEHQLKGLQLCQQVTKEQSDAKLRAFRLRDRVMKYLHKYAAATLFGSKRAIQGSDSSDKDEKAIANGTDKNLTQPHQYQLKGIMHEAEFGAGMMTEVGMMKHEDIIQILEDEVRNIDMDEEELDEQGLIQEMETDLKKLFQENEKVGGNERSKQICKMVDPWLMQTLKIANKDRIFSSHLIRRLEADEKEKQK